MKVPILSKESRAKKHYPKKSAPISTRILVVALLIALTLLISGYLATLISKLAVDEKPEQIDSLSDLHKSAFENVQIIQFQGRCTE